MPHLPPLIEAMRREMKDRGIGIAANQLGVLKRLFLMNTDGKEHVVINPLVTSYGAETIITIEGCLSFPGKKVRVRRVKEIEATWLDEKAHEHRAAMSGIEAACFLHELDHLNGKTMIDRQFSGRAPG
jgi:peptide deformylase